MNSLIVSYPNDGRQLKRLITMLLKSWNVIQVQRFNYVKSYTLHEGKIKQEEQKLLIIKTSEDKLEKCKEMLMKNNLSLDTITML